MTAEQQIWSRLRDEAQAFLPADFAQQVICRAQNQNKTAGRECVLIAITAGVCLLSVAVGNWYLGNHAQNRNLA
jgi:hypothetical protein